MALDAIYSILGTHAGRGTPLKRVTPACRGILDAPANPGYNQSTMNPRTPIICRPTPGFRTTIVRAAAKHNMALGEFMVRMAARSMGISGDVAVPVKKKPGPKGRGSKD